MDDDDFLELIELVKRQMNDAGIGELADDQNYLSSTDGGEERLPSPRQHLLSLLSALVRDLRILDAATTSASLDRISRNVEGRGPEAVFVELPRRADEGDVPRVIRLDNGPSYSTILEELNSLIRDIGEPPPPAPAFGPRFGP